ncbi:MAG: OsmC family protein [Granulosicoccus sp.]|nr:OsmC family protein [Granulosicoccus sp.]
MNQETATPVNVDNGVNVEALMGAREALSAAPAAARFQWRAASQWIRGTHTRTDVENYFGLGEEQKHKTVTSFDTDHPELFASEDHGPTPIEYMLVGLAGCLTAGIASIAQNRNIQLHSVKAEVSGDMDLQGVLGIDGDVRNGFDNVEVKFDIDADASRADIEALVAQSQKRSAVFDIISNPTDVSVVVS